MDGFRSEEPKIRTRETSGRQRLLLILKIVNEAGLAGEIAVIRCPWQTVGEVATRIWRSGGRRPMLMLRRPALLQSVGAPLTRGQKLAF